MAGLIIVMLLFESTFLYVRPRQLRDPSAEDGASLSLVQRWPADRGGWEFWGVI